MCELISWIEKENEILFLTNNDINSSHGKKTLESCLDNDFLGHNAIRKFYNIDKDKGIEQENRNFWDGNLPQKIKDAWNSGQFDCMMKYLQIDDLGHIVKNAPDNFIYWVLKNRYADFESMKKDKNRDVRIAGYFATGDFESMKKDNDWDVRLVGYVATGDFESMNKDKDWDVRFVGYVATGDFESMKKNENWSVRIAGYASTKKDFESMKKDENWSVRIAGYFATRDFKSMKKDEDMDVRLAGYFATRDFKSMKKDEDIDIKLVGYVVTKDFSKSVRPMIA